MKKRKYCFVYVYRLILLGNDNNFEICTTIIKLLKLNILYIQQAVKQVRDGRLNLSTVTFTPLPLLGVFYSEVNLFDTYPYVLYQYICYYAEWSLLDVFYVLKVIIC